MKDKHLASVVLAAGLSTRMRSDLPKVLHPLAGFPIIDHVISNVKSLDPERIVLVISSGLEEYAKTQEGCDYVFQVDPKGTADAVEKSDKFLCDFTGDILVIYGDSPFLSPKTMRAMIDARRKSSGPNIVVLGFESDSPDRYGRLVLNSSGKLVEIVESLEATPEQLENKLCNSGVMVIDGNEMFKLLSEVDSNNKKGERYLTDIINVAQEKGLNCSVVIGDEKELMGIDNRADLAIAEAIIQSGLRSSALDGGASLLDPQTVYFSSDTVIGQDVVIEPNVFFGPNVTIGNGTRIRANCHIEGAQIGTDVVVGPFARIRPGTKIDSGASIGNFVETKNTVFKKGAKANHLSYLGDASIGSRANIGAGTITCNYDGFSKSVTKIGDDAFIGSNTALIAPVSIGSGAVVGAGSAIKRDVADDSLALTRSDQSELPGWAAKRRSKQKKKKD